MRKIALVDKSNDILRISTVRIASCAGRSDRLVDGAAQRPTRIRSVTLALDALNLKRKHEGGREEGGLKRNENISRVLGRLLSTHPFLLHRPTNPAFTAPLLPPAWSFLSCAPHCRSPDTVLLSDSKAILVIVRYGH